MIGKILRGWFTGPDNDTPDAGRFLWVLSGFSAIGYTGAHLYLNGDFSIVEFGGGMGAILALGGFGVAAKDKGSKEARV